MTRFNNTGKLQGILYDNWNQYPQNQTGLHVNAPFLVCIFQYLVELFCNILERNPIHKNRILIEVYTNYLLIIIIKTLKN